MRDNGSNPQKCAAHVRDETPQRHQLQPPEVQRPKSTGIKHRGQSDYAVYSVRIASGFSRPD